MKTIAFINPLGGSGKTTSVWALGTGLHKKGYKVLLVDLDWSGTLTYMAGVAPEHLAGSICDVFRGDVDIQGAVHSIKSGLDIITSSKDLFQANLKFTQLGREYMLKESLKHTHAIYDYCIIDTAPYLDVLLTNALTAGESVIIPMQDEEYALNVMGKLKGAIDNVIKYTNPGLEIRGFLMISAVFEDTFSQSALLRTEEMAKKIGTKVFRTKINSLNRAKELAIRDYRDFVDEFLEYE